MKILIVGPAHPYRGGIADTNESLCRAFLRNGHDAELLTFTLQYPKVLFPGKTQYTSDPAPEDLKIKRKLSSINPLSWLRAARYIRRIKPELVVIRYWIPFLGPSLGSLARLIRKRHKVVALCDNILPHEGRIGDRQFTRYFTKSCDGFITMSKTVRSELSTFSSKPSLYMPHPINDNLGSRIPKSEARGHLGLDPDAKYLLFFGLIRPYKGLDITLKAMADDRLKDMDVKLLVVGEFYEGEEKYRTFIEENQLHDRVIIKNEFVPGSDIKYYFSASDLLVQTYHTASQSGITQLAYNFDLPMLVTDVGGLKETVPHGVVGYICPKEPEVIASNISDYYRKEKEEEFRKNVGREKLKYSWDEFASQLVEFFINEKNSKAS